MAAALISIFLHCFVCFASERGATSVESAPDAPPSISDEERVKLGEKLRYYALKALDALDDLVIAQKWEGITPDFLPEPVFQGLNFDILGQELRLWARREVLAFPGSRWGTAIRDTFRVYYQVGPEVAIPVWTYLFPRAAAQAAFAKEYAVVRPATGDWKKDTSSEFYRRYALPWEIRDWRGLADALDYPEDTGVLVNDYADLLAGSGFLTGLDGTQIFSLNLGLEVDARRFNLGSKLVFREGEGLRVIRESDHGAAYDADFRFETVFYFPYRLRFFRSTREKSNYHRETYAFSRTDAGVEAEEARFRHAIGRKIEGDREFYPPTEEVDARSEYRKHKFSFILPLGPDRKFAKERIRSRGEEDNGEYFHAFVIRNDEHTRIHSTAVEARIGEDGGVAEARVVTQLRFFSEDMPRRKLNCAIERFNRIAGKADFVACPETPRRKRIGLPLFSHLGPVTASLNVVFHQDSIERAWAEPERAVCQAMARASDVDLQLCDEPSMYARGARPDRWVMALFEGRAKDWYRLRQFVRGVRRFREARDLETRASRFIRFMQNFRWDQTQVAALIELGGKDLVSVEARIASESESGCQFSASLGPPAGDSLLVGIRERAELLTDPDPLVEIPNVRLARTHRDDFEWGF